MFRQLLQLMCDRIYHIIRLFLSLKIYYTVYFDTIYLLYIVIWILYTLNFQILFLYRYDLSIDIQ